MPDQTATIPRKPLSSINRDCDIPAILINMTSDQREHDFSSFGATYLRYRRVVAEWMIDVCEYFHLHLTTTHAAIAYLDRLQPNDKFSRYEWQMLALCCVLISSKYNECEEHVPDRATLEDITQQSITNETILSYELWALKRMGWKLNARTVVSFLVSYMGIGIISTKEQETLSEDASSCATRLQQRMFAHATASVIDVRFKAFKSSDVACAIVYFSREEEGFANAWSDELTAVTSNDPLKPEVAKVIEMLKRSNETPSPASPERSPTSPALQSAYEVSSPAIASHQQKQGMPSPTSVEALGGSSPEVYNKENLSASKYSSTLGVAIRAAVDIQEAMHL